MCDPTLHCSCGRPILAGTERTGGTRPPPGPLPPWDPDALRQVQPEIGAQTRSQKRVSTILSSPMPKQFHSPRSTIPGLRSRWCSIPTPQPQWACLPLTAAIPCTRSALRGLSTRLSPFPDHESHSSSARNGPVPGRTQGYCGLIRAVLMIRAAFSLSLNTKRANSGCVMFIGSAPCFALLRSAA